MSWRRLKLKIAVCDDEKFERDRIKDLICIYSVEKNIEIDVDFFATGEDLFASYEKGKYTMIFPDIEIGKNDGIEVADRIRRIPDHDVTIMFVTNYPEYMQQSFDVRAAQFFSKPLKYEIFKEKMNKILDYMSCEEDKRVIVNQNNKKIIISISDICTIESVKSIRSNSDILITTMSGELYVKGKLKEFNSKYKNMLLFAHRSILVNIMNIYKWMGNRIEMRNGRNVNISRSNMPILKEAFAENVLRRIGR